MGEKYPFENLGKLPKQGVSLSDHRQSMKVAIKTETYKFYSALREPLPPLYLCMERFTSSPFSGSSDTILLTRAIIRMAQKSVAVWIS